MKAIVNFDEHTITVNEETSSFEEAGIYCNPNNEDDFLTNDCDNHLYDKGIDKIIYVQGNSITGDVSAFEK